MLIKYYTAGIPNLHIIENVSNVVANAGFYDHRKDSACDFSKSILDKISDDENWPRETLTIDYVKEGTKFRLFVFGVAYICNNEGKTIEKVTPN